MTCQTPCSTILGGKPCCCCDNGNGPVPGTECYAMVSGGTGPLVLPANRWVQLPFNAAGPARNLLLTGSEIEIPPGPADCAGDYKISFGLTLTATAFVLATSHVLAVVSLNGDPGVGVELKPTQDWSDLIFDLLDVPMFGLQGKTIWNLKAADFVGLYLRSVGGATTVDVNTTDLDVHRLAPDPISPA